jgi:GAF domain-containing protein
METFVRDRTRPPATRPEVRHHPHEAERLAALRSYEILDTEPSPVFDALTRLAARVCYTPISTLTLIDRDRQWFLSHYGLDSTGGPRAESVCSDVVAEGKTLVVTDLSRVERYAGISPIAAPDGLRAYAGVPLIGRDGLPVGTLCVMDTSPRDFSPDQLLSLAALAEQVVTTLELRRYELAATDAG